MGTGPPEPEAGPLGANPEPVVVFAGGTAGGATAGSGSMGGGHGSSATSDLFTATGIAQGDASVGLHQV